MNFCFSKVIVALASQGSVRGLISNSWKDYRYKIRTGETGKLLSSWALTPGGSFEITSPVSSRSAGQYDGFESMPATVRLNDIVDALEIPFDESTSFLDRDTGQVETVSHDLLRMAEECGDDEEPDLPAWQKQEWDIAKRIVSTDRFEKLPTKFEVHEWSIMRDFSYSVESDQVREDLLNAIHGTAAFRYFKDVLRRRGIESAWFAFRSEALRQIAINWCEENSLGWE